MCRGITCAILTVFNLALLIGGCGVLTFGSLLKYNKALLKTLISKALSSAGGEWPSAANEKMNEALESIEEIAEPVGNVFFILGIVICCVAGLAFVGLCCHIRIALIIYAVLVALILAAHATILILYFTKQEIVMKFVEKHFMETVEKYKSIASEEPESLALAVLMPAMECCGYNNGTDFYCPDAKFTKEDVLQSQKITNLMFPIPCCKPLYTGIGSTDCPAYFNSDNSNFAVGCKEKIVVLVNKIMMISLILVGIEIAIMILLIINLCSSG